MPNVGHSLILIFLLALTYLFSIFLYPYLPAFVPSHWNLRGEVDAYMGRFWAAFVMPLLPLGIYLLMTYLPRLDPQREKYVQFLPAYRTLRAAIVLLLVMLQWVTLAVALGLTVNVSLIMRIIIPLLFLVIGNYLGKIRHNYFVGVRTPWTLASEEVWNKTHRFTGRLFVGFNLVALLGVFLPPSTGFIVLILAATIPALTGTVYSYLLYRQIETK